MDLKKNIYLAAIVLSLSAPGQTSAQSCNSHFKAPAPKSEELKDLSAKIAYIDSILDMKKHGLSSMADILKEHPQKRLKLIKALEGIDFSKGFTEKQLVKINSIFFKEVIGNRYLPASLTGKGGKLSMNEKQIHEYITKVAMEKNLVAAMKPFLTDTPNFLARRIIQRTKKGMVFAFNLSFFTASALVKKLPTMSNLYIPQELINKVISEGAIKVMPEIEEYIARNSMKIAGRTLSRLETQKMADWITRVTISSTVLFSGWITYHTYLGDVDLDDKAIVEKMDELTEIVIIQELEERARQEDSTFVTTVLEDEVRHAEWIAEQKEVVKSMSKKARADSIASFQDKEFSLSLLDGTSEIEQDIQVVDTEDSKKSFLLNKLFLTKAIGIYEDLPDEEQPADIITVEEKLLENMGRVSTDSLENLMSTGSTEDFKHIIRDSLKDLPKKRIDDF